MQHFFTGLVEASGMGILGLLSYAGGFVLAALVLLVLLPKEKKRIALSMTLFCVAALALVTAGLLRASGNSAESGAYRFALFLYMTLLGLATVNIAGVVLFRMVLHGMHIEPPPIVRDLLLAGVYVALLLAILPKVGVNLAGIVATSAVATAVIGFALQDTLGNFIGGMVLQVDHTIAEGDWVRIDNREGIVREIRWRQTTIEMNDWNTLVIPNSQLMKSAVVILGRRTGQPRQTRREVLFNVDFRFSPTDVIEAVQGAFAAETIPHVASEPAPNCQLVDYRDSYAQYAMRYFLTSWLHNVPTDSLVRTRLFAALKRSGISLAIPAIANFATIEDEQRTHRKRSAEQERRTAVLRGVSLFSPLLEDEIAELATSLRTTPFVRGESITRQGSVANWLYIMYQGTAEVRVASGAGGPSQLLATLGPGSFFGEMGLLTGEPRSATVVAQTDVACYRLDKEAFLGVLKKRPEVAAEISRLLATRRAELDAAREGLDQAAARRRAQKTQADLLNRIRSFFRLAD